MEQAEIDRFLPPFKPLHFLDEKNPKTWGSYAEDNVLMEFKYSVQKAMLYGKRRIKEIFSELSKITGRDHGGLIEAYRTEGAEVILVAMGSMAGTIKDEVDRLRSEGKPVGLIKIRCYRPFPHEDIWEAIKSSRVVAVMEADFSMGSEGAVGMDLKAKVCGRPGAPLVLDFITGLGGREVNQETVEEVVAEAEKAVSKKLPPVESYWVGLDPSIVP
jgi:pyruvate ferredoxin oxidoreductase alpha subunit